jgi:hypothetical protein
VKRAPGILICIEQFQRQEGHAGSSRRCSAIPPTVLALADEVIE